MSYEPTVMRRALARLERRREGRERRRYDLERELYAREPRLRELDAALDVFSENTAPALALRSALTERLGDLWEMYSKNHAVQQYKEGMKK